MSSAPWPSPDLAPSATTVLLAERTSLLLSAIRSLDDDAVRRPTRLPRTGPVAIC